MLKNNIFDLVFSIGANCGCSSYLRKHWLQTYSLPFDWLTGATFRQKIDMLVNDFEDFTKYEYFKYVAKDPNADNDDRYDYYKNTKTGFFFIHDFTAKEDFKSELIKVETKYNRRIKRLYKSILTSNKVLCVWFDPQVSVENKELYIAYQDLKDKFPKQNIFFLIIENKTDSTEIFFENLTPNILKASVGMQKNELQDTVSWLVGNAKKPDSIFKQIKTTRTNNFFFMIKVKTAEVLIRVLSTLILLKSSRHKFRTFAKNKLKKIV